MIVDSTHIQLTPIAASQSPECGTAEQVDENVVKVRVTGESEILISCIDTNDEELLRYILHLVCPYGSGKAQGSSKLKTNIGSSKTQSK